MKTAISLPDDVLTEVDELSQQLGVSRSEFFRTAAMRYSEELRGRALSEAIDAYVDETGDDGTGDHAFLAHSRRQLLQATEDDEW
ncbi:MAG: ribbon-helix-helix protein, CopG family [Propionibacteriaceae bacterium]|jgi:predicted DNA-binding protein|nr:ribbon-helix-helix protein, CopG family [Propionibacteriaceae bacterium]